MIQEIYIIDDDESSIMVFKKLFENDHEYKFISVKSEQIDIALKNIALFCKGVIDLFCAYSCFFGDTFNAEQGKLKLV